MVVYDALARYVALPLGSVILIGVGCLLVGLFIGWLLLPSRKKVRELENKLEETVAEHQVYKSKVGNHFHKTSELVAAMTSSYKAVYDHLAEGAHTLCEEGTALPGPAFGAPRIVFETTTVNANGDSDASEQTKATADEEASTEDRDDGKTADDAAEATEPKSTEAKADPADSTS